MRSFARKHLCIPSLLSRIQYQHKKIPDTAKKSNKHDLVDCLMSGIIKKTKKNLGQTEDKVSTQLRTELRTAASSSSSNISITTTTELPDEWKEIKTNPLSYFMGIMKRVGVYAAPENYESEKDRALRIYIEAKKRQQEKQAAIEVEMIEVSYNEWISALTDDEKKSLLPDHVLKNKLEGPKIAALKMYFKQNIWPNKKNEISQQFFN